MVKWDAITSCAYGRKRRSKLEEGKSGSNEETHSPNPVLVFVFHPIDDCPANGLQIDVLIIRYTTVIAGIGSAISGSGNKCAASEYEQ